jgi:hypothetical protein
VSYGLVIPAPETGGDALREQMPQPWVVRGGSVVAESVLERRLVRGA